MIAPCRRGAEPLRRQGRPSPALRPVPPARDVGNRDHDRRRSLDLAAVRPARDRRPLDDEREVDAAVARLSGMSYAERAANGCIGVERADLVLAGCAILEAIRARFPSQRVRIADRGLREGILAQMMRADRVGPHARPRARA